MGHTKPLLNLLNLKIIAVAFIVISTNLFSQGWQWQNPLPQGNPISSLQYLNKDVVWASVSGGGSLLKSTDGGETWEIFVLPESFHVYNVFFINNDVGWACGENYVFGTTDGGKNWKVQLYDASHSFYTITFSNEKLGWVAGLSRIYHTIDGGKTWQQQVDFYGYINSLFLLDSLHLWAANTSAAAGAIFYTKDGGKNWTADSTIQWGYDIQFIDSLNGWVSGRDKIAHTTDGGKTWITQLEIFNSNIWEKIFITDKKHGFAIISLFTSNIAVTTDGGEHWKIKNNLSSYILNAISFYDSLNGLAAGWGGVILKTTDGGINWELITKSATLNGALYDISFIDDSTGWVCGFDNTPGIHDWYAIILKTTNGGKSWTKSGFNNIDGLSSIYFIDSQKGFAVGSDSTILKTTDGGLSWLSINQGLGHWNDIDFSNYPTGWITGFSNIDIHGRLIKTTDGGETWSDILSLQFGADDPEVQFTSPNIGWIKTDIPDSTEYTRLYKTTDSGISWFPVLSSDRYDLASMDFISNEIGWVSTYYYPENNLPYCKRG